MDVVAVRLLQVAFVVGALGLLALGVREARAGGRVVGDLGLALLVTALALALRLWVPFGPHDVNPVAVRALLPPETWAWHRGVGASSVHRLLLPPWRAPEETDLFVIGAIFGALSCGFLVGVARGLGLGREASLTAGVLLALDVAHVRLSHTDSPVVIEVALALGATLAGLSSIRRGWGRAALIGAALLTVAVNARAESPLSAVLVVGLLAAVAPRSAWDRRWILPGLVVAVGVVLELGVGWAYYVDGPNVASLPDWRRHDVLVHGWRAIRALDPLWTAPVVALAMLAGLGVGGLPVRTRLAVAAAVVSGSVWDGSHAVRDGLRFGFTHFQLRADPFALLLAASVVERARRRGVWVGHVAAGVLVVAAALVLPRAWSPTVSQEEYAFVHAWLPRLPKDCVVVVARMDFDAGVVSYRNSREWPAERGPNPWRWTDEPVPPSTCRIWYRAGDCSIAYETPAGDAVRKVCADFEASHRLVPIAEAELRGGTWMTDVYREPVRVGFYRVR